MENYLLFVGALNLSIAFFQEIRRICTRNTKNFSKQKSIYYTSLVDELAKPDDCKNSQCPNKNRLVKEKTVQDNHNIVVENFYKAETDCEKFCDTMENFAITVAVICSLLTPFALFLEAIYGCHLSIGVKFLYLLFLLPEFAIVLLPVINWFRWKECTSKIDKQISSSCCLDVLNKAKENIAKNKTSNLELPTF